jgi:hypothetical protein
MGGAEGEGDAESRNNDLDFADFGIFVKFGNWGKPIPFRYSGFRIPTLFGSLRGFRRRDGIATSAGLAT